MPSKRGLSRVSALVWLLLFASRMGQASPAQEPLRIEEALGVLVLNGPIALSPDGGWVAYTVQDNRKRESMQDARYAANTPTGAFTAAVGCDIWITNAKTGESRNLTQSTGTSWWPVWSPNGKHLAFYSDRSGIAHLWVWDTATEQIRQLSDAIVRPFNFQVVRWTPDSRKILVKLLPEGMTVEQGADLISGRAHEGESTKASSTGPTVTVYSSFPAAPAQESLLSNPKSTDNDTFMDRYLSDLALVDQATGQIERIVKKLRLIAGYWISPDGKYLAYTRYQGRQATTQQPVYELVLFSLADESTRLLAHDLEEENALSVSWSPDSHSLAYITAGKNAKGDCFLVYIEGGLPRDLTQGPHQPFGGYHQSPLWDASGNNIFLISSENYGRLGTDTVWKASVHEKLSFSVAARISGRVILDVLGPSSGGRAWSPDSGHSLIIATRDENTKRVGFYRVDVSRGEATKVFEESSYFGPETVFDVSREGQAILYVAEDAQHPQDIWIANSDFSKRRRVSDINPQLKGVAFGASRVIDWRSIDGSLLHGALLLPANYQEGKKYPLIVDVYGGSYLSEMVYHFGLAGTGVENLQLLATRGYAVLLPDSPLHNGTPMLDLLKTVMPGVDRVIDLGIADPDQLGVMGHSYGGYSTIALIVQTIRFKAAVDIAGVVDLISGYGEMDNSGASWGSTWSETGQGRMIGTPWQSRDRYIENSPIFYLDRVQSPLLIIHGELDAAVPHQQPEEVFVGLRRLGKEVVYAKYMGEGHSEGMWRLSNVVDYWNRVIEWFDNRLKLDSPPPVQSSQ